MATIAAAIAAPSFQNMVEPPCAWDALAGVTGTLGGARLGDLEGVAIGSEYVDGGAGLECFRALDPGVPARAPVAYACETPARVDPTLEARRHASVDRRHLLGAVLRSPDVYSVAARTGDDESDDALDGERLADARGAGRAERGDAEHEQVERP